MVRDQVGSVRDVGELRLLEQSCAKTNLEWAEAASECIQASEISCRGQQEIADWMNAVTATSHPTVADTNRHLWVTLSNSVRSIVMLSIDTQVERSSRYIRPRQESWLAVILLLIRQGLYDRDMRYMKPCRSRRRTRWLGLVRLLLFFNPA